MKIRLQLHWLWFFVVLAAFTTYGYIEHINRFEAVFGIYPLKWLLFYLLSLIGVSVGVYGSHLLIKKILQRNSVILEIAAVIVGAAIYVYIAAPLFNFIFSPVSQLPFPSILPFVVLLVGLFLVVRLVLYLILQFLLK